MALMATLYNKNPLWQFIDEEASFRVHEPKFVNRLYFPLANEAGILSSITPDLHGDIKTSHNSFLTLPVSIEDLHNIKSSRNFWVHVQSRGASQAWSLTGVSALQNAADFLRRGEEKVSLWLVKSSGQTCSMSKGFFDLRSTYSSNESPRPDPDSVKAVSRANKWKMYLWLN